VTRAQHYAGYHQTRRGDIEVLTPVRDGGGGGVIRASCPVKPRVAPTRACVRRLLLRWGRSRVRAPSDGGANEYRLHLRGAVALTIGTVIASAVACAILECLMRALTIGVRR
jgi:hypothetical protein